MPAKKRTGGPPSIASTNSDDPDKDDFAYRLKRQRNNDAVKKTRAKSKETATERKRHVELLRTQNKQYEAKIEVMKQNVKCLKELLLNNVRTEDQDEVIQKILDENSDDDDDEPLAT